MTGGLESLLFPRPQNRTDSIACCLADSFTCVGIVGVAIMAVGITGVGIVGVGIQAVRRRSTSRNIYSRSSCHVTCVGVSNVDARPQTLGGTKKLFGRVTRSYGCCLM